VGVLTAISILRGGWCRDREGTWLNVVAWRKLVDRTPTFRSITHMRGVDGLGNVTDQERPDSAVWSGHPSGTEYVFLWRIGRIEVGHYSDPSEGAEFALPAVDKALREMCESVAESLDASVEYTTW
jgi:hypothetical protein